MFRPREKRVRVNIPVVVTTTQLSPIYIQHDIKGITNNISLNGLGIKFRQRHGLNGGERVYVTLVHPSKRKRKVILAKVIWIKGLSAGLRFIKVFRDAKMDIDQFDNDSLSVPVMVPKTEVGKRYTGLS